MKTKTAIVFGATGLVGGYLVELLVNDPTYGEIKIFGRRTTGIKLPKVREYLVDLQNMRDYGHLIKGDELFICLGTTIRKAGSVARMEEIDRDYPARIAEIARSNGIGKIAVVSSTGADKRSKNYYMRIKGEMEQAITSLDFPRTVIVRPSILFGPRKEFRFGEWVGKGIMKVAGLLLAGPLKKYRGIHGKTVAKAMIALIAEDDSKIIYESDDLKL